MSDLELIGEKAETPDLAEEREVKAKAQALLDLTGYLAITGDARFYLLEIIHSKTRLRDEDMEVVSGVFDSRARECNLHGICLSWEGGKA